MAILTIDTKKATGEDAPNAPFSLRLYRQGRNAGKVIPVVAGGVVSEHVIEGVTDASGNSTQEVAPTISFAVQTYYELRVGGKQAVFTMPDMDALLSEVLESDSVTVSPGQGGSGGGQGTDVATVRAIVRDIVADPAEEGNTERWDEDKITEAIARVNALEPSVRLDSAAIYPASKLPTVEGTAANLYSQSWRVPSDAFTPERVSGPLVAETRAPTGGRVTGDGCYRTVFSDTDPDAQVLRLRLWPNQIINGTVKAGQLNIFDMGGALEVEVNNAAAVILTRRFRIKKAGSQNFGPFLNGGSVLKDLPSNGADAFALSVFHNTGIAEEGLLLGVGDEHESVFDIELVESGYRIGGGDQPARESGSLRYCVIRGNAALYTFNERFGLGQAISTNPEHFFGTGEDSSPLNLANPYTPEDRSKLSGVEPGAQVNVGQEYTQAEKDKVAGVEEGAQANVGHPYITQDRDRVRSVEDGATADQTGTEIVAAIDATLGNEAWKTQGTGGGGPTSGLEMVARDETLTGQGTAASPLGVENPFTAADEAKLDGIRAGAEPNVGQEYSQAEKDKLSGVETGAQRNVGVPFEQADHDKLDSVEDDATADQTGTEIVAAIDGTLGQTDWKAGGGGGGGTFVGLTDTPSALGTAGQQLLVNPQGNALVFADAATGEDGVALELLSEQNLDIEGEFLWTDTGVSIADHDLFYFSIGDAPQGGGGGGWFSGADLRGRDAQVAGGGASPAGGLQVATGPNSNLLIARTASNTLMLAANDEDDYDPMPLTVYGMSRGSGSSGGGGDGLTVLGSSDVDVFDPNRFVDTGIPLGTYEFYVLTYGVIDSNLHNSEWVRGADLLALNPSVSGGVIDNTPPRDRNYIAVGSGIADNESIGISATGTLLFTSNRTSGDPTPLTVHGYRSGSSTLTGLTDTPDALGTAGQVLAVNSAEDATEWVDAATGGGVGGVAFTQAEKNKLATVEDSADNNVRSDWEQTNAAMDDFIRNKPTIPNPADWAEDSNRDPVPEDKLGNQRFTAADETKLDGIQAGAQVNVGEEYTTAEQTKLAGIETGAQRNVGVPYLQPAQDKLDGIEPGAEVNRPADWDATGGDAAIRNKPADGELVPSGGTTGQVLAKTSATNYDTEWADASTGGATSFVDLDDSPDALGSPRQLVGMNAAGDALEFVDPASGGGASDFVSLTDTPEELGNAGQVPIVSSDRTALIFGDQTAAEAFTDLTDTPAALGTAGQALIVNATRTGIDYADVGEAGEVQLAAGLSDLPIGPVREVVRGRVPDNRSTANSNTVEFNLPIAASGRTLDPSLVVSSDNLTIRAAEAGTFLVEVFIAGVASTSTNGPAPVSASQPIRANGDLRVYVNNRLAKSGLVAYARYGREITDASVNANLVLEAGDVVQFRTLVRRIDAANVASMEWTGRVCVNHLSVTGSSTIIGVRSETVTNMVVLTQAAYDDLPSYDGATYYLISG